jgi:two-component system LytT family response regulator
MNEASAQLRVLIVDDEPLARRGLRVRLERLPDIDIVGECASGSEAVAAIEAHAPDVVLLDVQMPELDGFDVIDAVGTDRMPVTIFVTAYDAHAIRAFDAHALDYLLKPVDDERFVRSVERARARVAERDARTREREMGGVLAAARRDTRIVLRDRGRVLVLEHADVDWISAEGDYVRVYAGGRGYLVRHTMTAMEARLDPATFARIHRSAIVNVSRVREIRAHGDRDYVVVLRDDTRLKMSRSYRDKLPVERLER